MKPTALLLLLGCAPLSTIGTHERPVSICSRTNIRAVRVEVVLQDDWTPIRHTRYMGNADIGGHVCAEWPFPESGRGRWGYVIQGVRPDTTWEPWFDTWALAHGTRP